MPKKTIKNNVFSKVDFNSRDGMLTTVWGPSMWHYLHTMSFNYPVSPNRTQKKHSRDFVINLQYVLPCGKCRENLSRKFKKTPLTMENMKSRETFSKYIYELHESVNKMLNKRSHLSFEDVRDRYENFRARCAQPITTIRKTQKKKNERARMYRTTFWRKGKMYFENSTSKYKMQDFRN
jgi:hypothetical protein